jgi:hypothetical protein
METKRIRQENKCYGKVLEESENHTKITFQSTGQVIGNKIWTLEFDSMNLTLNEKPVYEKIHTLWKIFEWYIYIYCFDKIIKFLF